MKEKNISLYHLSRSQEIGKYKSQIKPRHLLQASAHAVKRLELAGELEGHTGCVNSIHWNERGDSLISGSDDLKLCIFDYPSRTLKHSWRTAHESNIFNARFMPSANDKTIISCARDNKVLSYKHVEGDFVLEKKYTCHYSSAKKFAVFDGDPNTFLSCSEDGTVRSYDLREEHTCNESPISEGCKDNVIVQLDTEVNSISTNPTMDTLFAIGCNDSFVRLYDRRMRSYGLNSEIRKANPVAKYYPSESNGCHVTGVKYSNDGKNIVASYSSDAIHMFDVNNYQHSIYPVPPFCPPEDINDLKKEIREMSIEACEQYRNHEYDDAIDCYTKIIEKCRKKEELKSLMSMHYSNRAAAYIRSCTPGCVRKALRDCQHGNYHDSNNVIVLLRKAAILSGILDYAEALKDISKAQVLVGDEANVSGELLAAAEALDTLSDNICRQRMYQLCGSDSDKDDSEKADSDDATERDVNGSGGNTPSPSEREKHKNRKRAAQKRRSKPTENKYKAKKNQAEKEENKHKRKTGKKRKEEDEEDEEDKEDKEEVDSTRTATSSIVKTADTNMDLDFEIKEDDSDDDDNGFSDDDKDNENDDHTKNTTNLRKKIKASAKKNPTKDPDSCSCANISLGGCVCENSWNAVLDIQLDIDGPLESLSKFAVYNSPQQSYSGHSNFRTVKDVNFYGPNSEYIVSGSDDGHLFIWDKVTAEVVQVLKGDNDVVNCMQGHPFLPVIACSGIDDTVKIFEPLAGKENPLEDLESIMEDNSELMSTNITRISRFAEWFQTHAIGTRRSGFLSRNILEMANDTEGCPVQ